MRKSLTYAFRITHIDNIPHIEKCGLVHANSPLRDPNYVSIGDTEVIGIRAHRNVKGYNLSEYIPFYLGPRSPMLYVIQNGYNGVQRISAEQIAYCIIRLEDIVNSTKECIFTDGHALSILTKFYGREKLGQISEIVNFGDVYSSQWNLEADLDLKRRKEAELLIKDDLEPQFVRGYVVYNETAKQRLVSSGIEEKKIVVNSGYYF
ncbi:MAG: DUF4433 domain-containing protein [Allobaculum sp.]|nr:DUF4433 domain-containing protein [Allobaculum sp.]